MKYNDLVIAHFLPSYILQSAALARCRNKAQGLNIVWVSIHMSSDLIQATPSLS